MNRKEINFNSFFKLFLEVVPELTSIYDEHIEDYDELLEHVLLGDVTRYAEELYSEAPGSESLAKLLEFLDRSYSSGDVNLKELISVSFLENLSRDQDSFEGISALLSPNLKSELSKYD